MYSAYSSPVDPYQTDAVLRLMVKREYADRIAKIAVKRNRPFYEVARECLVRGLKLVEESEKNERQ
jgi:hypothetical protein